MPRKFLVEYTTFDQFPDLIAIEICWRGIHGRRDQSDSVVFLVREAEFYCVENGGLSHMLYIGWWFGWLVS